MSEPLGDPLPRQFPTGPHPPINLSTTDLQRVQARAASLQRMDERRRKDRKRSDLSTALRRFNQSFSRYTDEDRVIDLAIALEASLLSGTMQEQAHKARMRAAAFLADERDPGTTAAFIGKFYDARSKIVHEGRSLAAYCERSEYCKKNDYTPERFVSESEEIIRAVLNRFLTELDAKPDIKLLQDHAENIDDQLLAQLGPRTANPAQSVAPTTEVEAPRAAQ